MAPSAISPPRAASAQHGHDVKNALEAGNPFEDIRAAMASLGLSTSGAAGYEQKFGLTVLPSRAAIQGSDANLLVTTSNASPTEGTYELFSTQEAPLGAQSTSTSMGNDVMSMLGTKWLYNMALGAAVSVASVATAQATTAYAVGECQVADVGTNGSGAQIRPTVDADSYIRSYQNNGDSPLKKYATDPYSFDEASTKVLIEPKHGTLEWDYAHPGISAVKEGWYYYLATKGFSGGDTFVIQVEKYGLKINVHYEIVVPYSDESPEGLCNPEQWKISQIDVEDANGVQLTSTTFTSANPFQSTSLTDGASELLGVSIGFNDLAGPVGRPGSGLVFDPNEWIAKAGSSAAGKMDMLSVLLHEYGHALGLDHSRDSHDFMARCNRAYAAPCRRLI
jgi:hypothetical protein